MQTDNQMRFSDLESSEISQNSVSKKKKDFLELIYHKILEEYQIQI